MSEKEENKVNNIWTQLPQEVLELIMKRLSLRDYLALGIVCSSCRSTVTNAIANKHCRPLPELPLIFLQSKEEVLFSLRTEREHCPKRSIFESTNIFCYGSVEGWMIMCDYVKEGSLSIFFFNPVTNRRVSVSPPLNIPSDSPIQGKRLFLAKMVASSGPDCYKSNVFLAALFNDYHHIAFYRLFDKSWNMIKPDQELGAHHFLDIEIMGSKLYVKTRKALSSIIVYDLTDSGNGSSPKTKVLATLPQISRSRLRIIDNQCHVSGSAVFFLAKHEKLDQLFLIYLIYNAIYKPEDVGYLEIVKEYVTTPDITAVKVFKMDMKKEPVEWIKCENLDDNVIFVSGTKSLVMSTTSLNRTDQESIRKNSVYFALRYQSPSDPWKGALLGIKHLRDSTIKYFSVEKSNHSRVPYPFWFVPSI